MPIPVTCALIIQSDKVLTVRRSAKMPLSGFWEFPGGKVEAGESNEACLIREIQEELGVKIVLGLPLQTNTHAYSPDKQIQLLPYAAQIREGEIVLLEHDAYRWLGRSELFAVNWAQADIPIVEELRDRWGEICESIRSKKL